MLKLRKKSKIISFAIVFSIIFSMMSFYTSNVYASYENILTNSDFEAGSTSGWNMKSGTIEAKSEAAHTGEYGVYVVHNDNVKASSQVFTQTFDFKSGEWYYLSAWVKAAEEPGNLKASVRIRTSSAGDAFKGIQRDMTYSLSTENWTHLENIAYVSEDCTSQFYIRAGNDNTAYAYDYYADDLILSKLTLNETDDVPLSGKLTINGPEEMNLTTDKVSFTNGGNVTDVVYNEQTQVWEVSYTGMTRATENTVVLALDISNASTKPTFVFTTASVPVSNNLLSTTSRDYDFETTPAGTSVASTSDTYVNKIGNVNSISGGAFTVQAASEVYPAKSGSQYLLYSGRTSAGMHRFNNVTGVELGKTYVISYYARLAEANSSANATVYAGGANLTINMFAIEDGTAVQAVNSVGLTTEWQRVAAYVTIIENTQLAEGTTAIDKGIHIGARFTGTADVHIDSYEIREVSSLDFDETVAATLVVRDNNEADGRYTVGMDVINKGAERKIYLVGVSYNDDGSLADFRYASADVSTSELALMELPNITDEHTLYIWDGNFKPLNKEVSFISN